MLESRPASIKKNWTDTTGGGEFEIRNGECEIKGSANWGFRNADLFNVKVTINNLAEA
jgi:hypothetical protein